MKKSIILGIGFLLLVSCNREFNRAMQSADKDYILEVADKEYDKKKWENALTLYDHAKNLIKEIDESKKVIYKSAYANYYNENHRLAGQQFKRYSSSFPTDSLAEETAYLAAQCYYEGSLEFNLDQSNSDLAIKEMQNFIDRYPTSTKISEANDRIAELIVRKEKKAFENAKTMYKIAQYKASSIAFDNMLTDFPDTQYREELLFNIFRSKANLGIQSMLELKKERLIEANTAYRNFLKNYPDSKFVDEANSLKKDVDKELVDEEKRLANLPKTVSTKP